MPGCDQAWSQVSCLPGGTFPVAPRPVAMVAALGWSPRPPPSACTHSGLGPLGHQSQPVIGTDHRPDRHGRAGNRGNRELPGACPPPSWGGYWRVHQRGRVEWEGCLGLYPGFQLSGRVGETRVRLCELSHLPSSPPSPQGQAGCALQPSARRSGTHSLASHTTGWCKALG